MRRLSNISKIAGLVLVIFIAQNVMAEGYCRGRILNGEDSAYIKVSQFSDNAIDENSAEQVINFVRARYNCQAEDLKVIGVQCSNQLEPIVNSPICRVDAEEGYFLIFQDYVGGVNVLFNRWD